MKNNIIKMMFILLFIIQALTGCSFSIGPENKNEFKTEYIHYKDDLYYNKLTGEINQAKNNLLQKTGRYIYFEGDFNPLK